jgi:hypothetical protein
MTAWAERAVIVLVALTTTGSCILDERDIVDGRGFLCEVFLLEVRENFDMQRSEDANGRAGASTRYYMIKQELAYDVEVKHEDNIR